MITTHYVELATAIMNRHVSALARVLSIGKQLVHEVVEFEASLLVDAGFSILGEDHVLWTECTR